MVSKAAVNTLVLGLSLGTAMLINILASAFESNWLPMLIMIPFVMLPIPIIFMNFGGSAMGSTEEIETALFWQSLGQCILGATVSSSVAMPLYFLHVDAINGTQTAMWIVADVIALAGAAFYWIRRMKEDD